LSLHKEQNADSSDEEIQDEDVGYRNISGLDVMVTYKILIYIQQLLISREFLQLLVVLRIHGLK